MKNPGHNDNGSSSASSGGSGSRKRKRGKGPAVSGGTSRARKTAALILEVLAGVRTPTQAAESLGVSPARYYSLEVRALEGLVSACEPRQKGPAVTPEKTIGKLESQIERLKRELSRQQALTRASQRAVGVTAPKKPKPSGKGKRKPRKATVRALRAAGRLRDEEAES